MIRDGFFSPDQPGLFREVADYLLGGDPYMLCADYSSYVECQAAVSRAFTDKKKWAAMSILNAAGMGKFSADRTISQYAREIWGVKPVPVTIPQSGGK